MIAHPILFGLILGWLTAAPLVLAVIGLFSMAARHDDAEGTR